MRKTIPFLLLASLFIADGRAQDIEPLVVRVNRAIDQSAAFLVTKQAEDGSFNKNDKRHPLGRTALCTYALLHAGYPQDHPAVKKALAFLGITGEYGGWKKPISTYEAGCLALLLNALGKEHQRQIHEICDWLVDNFNAGPGMWGYPDGSPDISNTQYAVLALKAGERHGYRAPESIWKRLIDTVIRLQAESGGVRYRGGTMYRASMTHAGMLILLFAEEALGRRAPKRDIAEAQEKGHRWLAETYDITRHPSGRGALTNSHYYYYMYGLERYAVFFGKEQIAGHDWYQEGAEELLRLQKKEGGWGALDVTAFAILFLRRATFTIPEARGAGADDEEHRPVGPPDRPRPKKEVPCIREWLVAGPFLGKPGEDDFLFTTPLNPKRTTPVRNGPAGKRKWEHHLSAEDKVDFKNSVGEKPWASFLAAAYIHSDADRGAVLWIGSDDGLRVWLNGKEVLFGHHHGHSGDDFYRVPIHLEKGRNLLLLQVENLEYSVHFKARVSDQDGRPQDGLVFSTSPKTPRR